MSFSPPGLPGGDYSQAIASGLNGTVIDEMRPHREVPSHLSRGERFYQQTSLSLSRLISKLEPLAIRAFVNFSRHLFPAHFAADRKFSACCHDLETIQFSRFLLRFLAMVRISMH
jgi:hypothetical protein